MSCKKQTTADRLTSAATRREFLQSLAAASAAALMAGEPRVLRADSTGGQIEHPKPKADTCILLWMGGGMAAPETFDPKRYAPFEVGLPVEKVMSTFPAINTAVDNIKISQGLEHIASVMDRGTLIRSHVLPDLGHILHSRHQYHWHTGYVPPQTVAAPHIGAWMARVLGPLNPVIPPFINIGQRLEGNGESEELKAFTTGGFFGSEYGPFNLPVPEDAMLAVRPPKGMDGDRFEARYRKYRQMIKDSPQTRYASDYQQESMLRSVDAAHRLLSSKEKSAFDLSLEKKETAERYGNSNFGRGCLLARRLAEAGARYIEVTTEYIPFVHWDTHENGHTRLADLKKYIDAPIAQLVLDLEERGLLNRTLIVLASEFSRDMMVEGKPDNKVKDQVTVPEVITEMKHYGMHRHFTDAGCVLLFGGGTKRGYLHGKTALERPCKTLEKRVIIEDLHASIFRAMGISPKLSYEIEKRPFYVTRDGLGKPIPDLFA